MFTCQAVKSEDLDCQSNPDQDHQHFRRAVSAINLSTLKPNKPKQGRYLLTEGWYQTGVRSLASTRPAVLCWTNTGLSQARMREVERVKGRELQKTQWPD